MASSDALFSKILPAVVIFVSGFSTYRCLANSSDPVQAFYSIAVIATFLVSLVSISHAQSLAQASIERKLRSMVVVVVSAFALITLAFLFTVFMLLPQESSWIVAVACGLPACAGLGLLSAYRSLIKQKSSTMVGVK